MAIKIKSAAEIAQKYSSVAPGRSGYFESGVQATSPDGYTAPTLAAEPNYDRGVQQAIAAKRFGKGVAGAGERWKRKSLAEGPSRYATGTAGATQDYAAGFAPYQSVIANLTLPPRGPAGDPKNIERVRVIADALRKAKMAS
jgi:hypothetical protein